MSTRENGELKNNTPLTLNFQEQRILFPSKKRKTIPIKYV